MEEKNSKKSYYLPDELMKFFAEWSKPGRDYSTKVAGAVLVYMTLSPDLRKKAEQLAFSGATAGAVDEMRLLIERDTITRKMTAYYEGLPEKKRIQVLAEQQASKEKILHS